MKRYLPIIAVIMSAAYVAFAGAIFDPLLGKLRSDEARTFPGGAAIPSADHTHAESVITFSDITTNNASATKHGYFPKLPNTGSTFFRDDGQWATPAGAGTVTGPESSTDGAIVLWDLLTGTVIKDSAKTISIETPLTSSDILVPTAKVVKEHVDLRTPVATLTHAAAEKTTPIDANELPT